MHERRPGLEGLEDKWAAVWEEEGTYRFDASAPAERVYAIDTPPPTVSGDLHMGSVFSYTQTDVVARFRRMRGREVFYPMGFDDNGLPTERRVQLLHAVRCGPDGEGAVPREAFIELCRRQAAADEERYEALWRRLGLSVDWTRTYTTIGERAQRASQRGFLRLHERGLAYSAEAPVLWDVDFRTAVAQAETEDREIRGAWHRLRFGGPDGPVEVDTTRPELLPACVALVVHPDDDRHRHLVGREVIVPLFGSRAPVRAHEAADPERGTGVAMVCTFGDAADVLWQRELGLPLRTLVAEDGTIAPVRWGEGSWTTEDPGRAGRHHDEFNGLSIEAARRRIVELLRAEEALVGDPRPMVHAVRFHEKGDRPLEILATRQWFFRTLDYRDELLRRGRELDWHPPHMRARFEAWVEGLNADWCVSRQRCFGVPVPAWYPLDEDGRPRYGEPLLPDEGRLPIDPTTDVPDGYGEEDRGRPGGFVGDPDVLDTWATSSLTPQIAGGWEDDPETFDTVFPMDLRPQSHDIIRTWLFTTLYRSHVEHGDVPWRHAAISGWVSAPEGGKLSKSRAQDALDPDTLIERYGADAVRYWAAAARLGADTALSTEQMGVGRRLAMKVLNAARFVLRFDDPGEGPVPVPLDRSALARLAAVIDEATAALEGYDHAGALEATEALFWAFCDDYLELVKDRAYANTQDTTSAVRTLRTGLAVFLRLLAPYLPFVCEEVWSWWREGSVHRAPWPGRDELPVDGDPRILEAASAVLHEIRRAKTEVKRSVRTPAARVVVGDRPERLALIEPSVDDLRAAGHVDSLELRERVAPSVKVELEG